MKKTKIMGICIMLVLIFTTVNSLVYASDFFSDATTWYNNAQNAGANGYGQVQDSVSSVINQFSNLIEIAGTAIIIIATMVLGVKYIFGSVNDKISVKENMISLIVACIFFFGWSSIRGLLITGSGASQQLIIYSGASDFKSMVIIAFSILSVILRIVGVVGVLYVGIKYIFSGAQGRAELKTKSFLMMVGIVLVFAATVVLSTISSVITETL